jgi:hypothetical protein
VFATRLSCHDFLANQFRLLLSAAAYVLDEYVRRVGLSETELEHAEVRTIRTSLFKICAWVKKTSRRLVVRMAGNYRFIELFERAVERMISMRVRLAATG